MLLRSGIRPRLYVGFAAAIALSGALMVLTCSKSNPVTPATPTWALTIDVLDGYSGSTIANAHIQFMTDKMKDTVLQANSQGRIKIEGLSAGSQIFNISNSDTSVKYTSAVITATGIADSLNHGELKDVATTVKLFPLSGSISGRIVSQINQIRNKVPASGVVISVAYANSDLSTSSPRAFQVKTDSLGTYSLTGLPVAAGCKVTVAPATINGVDFAPDSLAQPVLVSGITVPLGSIIMRPINASSFKQMKAAPLVIAPNEVISINYSDALDSLSYSTLEGVGGSQSVKVNSSVKDNAIAITPSISLVDGSQYYLTVYAFGKNGGDTTSKTTLTVKGGGLIDIVSSNVLDGNKRAIDGLNLSDSMVFVFRTAIKSANPTVMKQDSTPIQISSSVNGSTLVIKPNGNWESTTYTVKISANLSDSTTATFSFNITTVGGLNFISSNVYNPNTSSAINGLGFKDTIVVTANKTLASAQATLTVFSSGSPAPLSVSVSGAMVKIAPYDNLRPATQYTFAVTVSTAQGETKSFQTNFTTAASSFYPLIDNIRFDNDPNQPVLDFAPNGTIIIKMSSTVKSATAQINGGNPAINVVISSDTIKIAPVTNLSEGVAYNLKLSAENNTGAVYNENNGNYVTGFYIKSTFRPVSDNIRFDNDPSKPVLNFPSNGAIIIIMSSTVQTATAQITGGGTPAVAVNVTGDTIMITPQVNLTEATPYSLKISAQSASGVIFNANGGNYVTGFQVKNTFTALASNIRYNNDPAQPVLDFAPNGAIAIIMSDSVQSATALLSNTGATVPSDVRISGDTIRIVPQDVLPTTGSFSITLEAKSYSGLTYQGSPFVTAFKVQNKVRVLSSNVLSSDGLGLSDIPVTITMYYVLSSTPDPTTLSVIDSPAINTTLTVSGDTVKVKPVSNLASGAQYQITINGKTTQGNIINLAMTAGNNKAFTTRVAPYVVATNMQDANGSPAANLLPTTELWVKFSRNLAAAASQQLGGGAAPTVTYVYGALSNNATVRVSNDTLFAKFMTNALPAYGATITLKSASLLFADATTLGAGAVDLSATIIKKATPYVIATNGIKDNAVVDTFGVGAESWIVSSLSFRSIDKIKDGPDGMTSVGANNLVLTNVRTSGDTIFFKPAVPLGYNTQYQVAFEATLADSSKYTGSDLKLSWKTQKSLYIVSSNDMVSGFTAYRPFNATGDSLVVTFSKPIDVTKPYSIAGLVTRMSYSWSADNKTLTVKPIDTLAAKVYAASPDYSITGAAEYGAITVTGTAGDGEAWAAKATNVSTVFNDARPALKVHTVMGIEVLNTNVKVSNVNKSVPYVNTDNRKLSDLITAGLVAENDSMNTSDTLKVYFSTAVDSALIASDPSRIQVTLGGVPINISITYTSGYKTVLIKPLLPLATASTYVLSLANIQAKGMSRSDGNAKVSYNAGANILTFKTRPAATKPVCLSQPVLNGDTATAANVWGKRLAYGGSIANAYASGIDAADVVAQNKINLMWYEVGFRNTTDTVTHYQLSVKGIDGNWYDLKALIAAKHYNSFDPLADSIHRYTLDLSTSADPINDVTGAPIGPTLRVSAKTNYNNGASIFNYGTAVQVRIRPVVSADALWDASDLSGTWSSPMTFQDNVAPCDTDYVVNPAAVPGNLLNTTKGGVSVTPTACAMARSGLADADYVFTFVFPEDMDTSSTSTNVPTITTYYEGIAPANAITKNAAKSYWTNGYTYKLTMTIPGGIDWTGSSLLPYYAVSVAGMKDASGIAIAAWGSVGTAATGTTLLGVTGQAQGTLNMLGLAAY